MNDSAVLSAKKVLIDDDEAEVLLPKIEAPLPASLKNQNRDLLVDNLDPAWENKKALQSDKPISQVRFFLFDQNSLLFKMGIKTFHLRTNFTQHSHPQQASYPSHLCTSPTSNTVPFRS